MDIDDSLQKDLEKSANVELTMRNKEQVRQIANTHGYMHYSVVFKLLESFVIHKLCKTKKWKI